MYCEILETLYVRSNGDIPCNDDAGEVLLLGRVELDPAWSIGAALAGEQFGQIRAALAGGSAPWPECARCAWLREHEPYADPLSERRIRKLQVEPSLRCNLRCPCCSNQLQTASRPLPYVMPVELFSRLVDSLAAEGYGVDELEYCGQGEPLLNPRFPRFVALARQAFPGCLQRVITNGNVDYAKATGREGIEEIYVSCDGARQASYEQYRIGGQVGRALEFLRAAPRSENGVRQRLIWKYILFEFNDSDEEIEHAQHLAQDLGVDILLFVLTHSKYHSERWTPENIAELPVLYPNVVTSVTPVHDRDLVGLTPIGSWRLSGLRRRGAEVQVEHLAAHRDHLDCSGWTRAEGGVDSIDVAVDGRVVGTLRTGFGREDVPGSPPVSGFSGRIPTPMPVTGSHRIDLVVKPAKGTSVRIRRRYSFGPEPAKR